MTTGASRATFRSSGAAGTLWHFVADSGTHAEGGFTAETTGFRPVSD